MLATLVVVSDDVLVPLSLDDVEATNSYAIANTEVCKAQ